MYVGSDNLKQLYFALIKFTLLLLHFAAVCFYTLLYQYWYCAYCYKYFDLD